MPTPERQKLSERETSAPSQAANLPMVDEAHASPEVRNLYAHFREAFGRPQIPGILQCFATHPSLLEHMMGLAQSMLFTEGALGRVQKEMIATAISSRNRCAYCADSHGFSLTVHGGPPELLAAAMECDATSLAFLPEQRVLISFVQKLTDDSASVEPDDIDTLRVSGWNDLQIAETIHITALFACFNRVVNGFGLSSQDLLGVARAEAAQGLEGGGQ